MKVAPLSFKLIWQQLLAPNEVVSWLKRRRMPKHLHGRLLYAGVYRFVFPEFVDENGGHTPCYVGQGGSIQQRLSDHLLRKDAERRDKSGNLVMRSGWSVRGSIVRADGNFKLEVLAVEGAIDLNGVILNQHSFDDPFERTLLENWAIRSSELVDRLTPINRGISQSGKDFWNKLRSSRKKHTGSRSTSEYLNSYVDPMQEIAHLRKQQSTKKNFSASRHSVVIRRAKQRRKKNA